MSLQIEPREKRRGLQSRFDLANWDNPILRSKTAFTSDSITSGTRYSLRHFYIKGQNEEIARELVLPKSELSKADRDQMASRKRTRIAFTSKKLTLAKKKLTCAKKS